jgi:hypothetical protein
MNEDKKRSGSTNFRIAHGVYLGVLMSPPEVAKATNGTPAQLSRALSRWTLCGDVSPAVFELLQVRQMLTGADERVTAFNSPRGLPYATFSHQVGAFQHRFLLPLFDRRVVQCLEDVCADGDLGYSLAGEGDQAIVWRSVFGPRDFMPVKALCCTIPEGQEEPVLEEYSTVLREARDPGRIPTIIAGTPVRFASVTAVPPGDLLVRLGKRYGLPV